MPHDLLPSLLLTMFAVGYTPGPANIYSLSCVLSNGRKAAMRAWYGLLCGAACAAVLTAVAAHFIGMTLGAYVGWVKYLGAAYILYLAWKTWRASIAEGSRSSCSFWDGFMVQLLNAKMILFYLTAYSSYVLPYSTRFVDLLPVAAMLMLAGPGANLVWLLAGSVLRQFVSRHQRTVDIVMSLALVACAVMIAVG